MRRSGALLTLVLTLGLLAACDRSGGDAASPTPASSPSPSPSVPNPTTGPPPTPTPTPNPTVSPTPSPVLHLPPDAPTTYDGTLTDDLAPLAPPGATLTSTASFSTPEDPVDLVAFAWRRGDPFAGELGFSVWQRFEDSPAWRAVSAFTDGPAKGVLGITFGAADLTGDGISDFLTREDRGGSGACATWRVLSPAQGTATQVFRHGGCDTSIELGEGASLTVREAVFEPGDSHCCPSAFRTTTLEWDGSAFVETDVVESPAPSP